MSDTIRGQLQQLYQTHPADTAEIEAVLRAAGLHPEPMPWLSTSGGRVEGATTTIGVPESEHVRARAVLHGYLLSRHRTVASIAAPVQRLLRVALISGALVVGWMFLTPDGCSLDELVIVAAGAGLATAGAVVLVGGFGLRFFGWWKRRDGGGDAAHR